MKKVMIIALILVGALLVPTVSAEVVLNEHMLYFLDTSDSVKNTYTHSGGVQDADRIILNQIQDHKDLHYIGILCEGSRTYLGEGQHSITYTLNGVEKEGVVYVDHMTNILGTVTGARFTLFFYDWDVTGLSGRQVITLSQDLGRFNAHYSVLVPSDGPGGLGIYRSQDGTYMAAGTDTITFTVVSSSNFESEITVEDTGIMYEAVYNRYDHPSYIEFRDNGTVVYSDISRENLELMFLRKEFDEIYIDSLVGVNYTFPLTGSGGQEDSVVTVYIRNSQTGALLAGAHIDISAFVNGEFHEVINETLPGGIYKGPLQPTAGGPFDPDYYRLIATADGYNSIMPHMDFEHRGAATLFVEMEPTSGAPVNENNTFIEFYVRDISANAVANAKVNLGGYMLWTNAQGYTQFEVPKNASYPYIVTKTGYLTIEGIATVGSNDRYVVNVALMAGAIPTQPTITPTITVEPTPTQTTPIQEDNIIGLSVKGLAKGFGIDYDTALLLFGLMIVFGAGGIVMSSVKGGAMEFIAGSIVGTFVAFALGLIPIWIFIIIAVVFGAYVLRVFVQGGQ